MTDPIEKMRHKKLAEQQKLQVENIEALALLKSLRGAVPENKLEWFDKKLIKPLEFEERNIGKKLKFWNDAEAVQSWAARKMIGLT